MRDSARTLGSLARRSATPKSVINSQGYLGNASIALGQRQHRRNKHACPRESSRDLTFSSQPASDDETAARFVSHAHARSCARDDIRKRRQAPLRFFRVFTRAFLSSKCTCNTRKTDDENRGRASFEENRGCFPLGRNSVSLTAEGREGWASGERITGGEGGRDRGRDRERKRGGERGRERENENGAQRDGNRVTKRPRRRSDTN